MPNLFPNITEALHFLLSPQMMADRGICHNWKWSPPLWGFRYFPTCVGLYWGWKKVVFCLGWFVGLKVIHIFAGPPKQWHTLEYLLNKKASCHLQRTNGRPLDLYYKETLLWLNLNFQLVVWENVTLHKQAGWYHQKKKKNYPNNTRVCALIDKESGRWLEDRVREEFLPHEAKAIISIALSTTITEDKLIWSATSNGCYSTKFAYHLLSNEAELSEPSPSNPMAHNQFWGQLWLLKVPNKIWHF